MYIRAGSAVGFIFASPWSKSMSNVEKGRGGEAHKEEKLEREKQIKAMRKRKTRNNISRHLSQWTK